MKIIFELMNKPLIFILINIFLVSCINYEEDILSLQESVALLELENQSQASLIADLQKQIDAIKKQQDEDRLAAEGYIQTALTTITQLTGIIEELRSNFINQAANLALLQVDIGNIEIQLEDLESQLTLIDSTGDISAINELLDEINNTIEENSNSLIDIISRISTLEIDDDKYNSDVVGCYALGDYNFIVLNNGIGFYEVWKSPATNDIITFTWEKINNEYVRFNFPYLMLFFQQIHSGELGWYIDWGSYDISSASFENLLFPLGGNNQGWIDENGYGKFVRRECPLPPN